MFNILDILGGMYTNAFGNEARIRDSFRRKNSLKVHTKILGHFKSQMARKYNKENENARRRRQIEKGQIHVG